MISISVSVSVSVSVSTFAVEEYITLGDLISHFSSKLFISFFHFIIFTYFLIFPTIIFILLFIRVIKMKVGFTLMPIALEGLGRISHLINIDTVEDLVILMKTVLTGKNVFFFLPLLVFYFYFYYYLRINISIL